MYAAADQDSKFNFKSSYFGDSGVFIDAIGGTASANPCFWLFYYDIPNVNEFLSPLGVSNVIIPGEWDIILRYSDTSK